MLLRPHLIWGYPDACGSSISQSDRHLHFTSTAIAASRVLTPSAWFHMHTEWGRAGEHWGLRGGMCCGKGWISVCRADSSSSGARSHGEGKGCWRADQKAAKSNTSHCRCVGGFWGQWGQLSLEST